jgi:uncharacterized protein YjiS (DUF1127 family)
MMMTCRSNEFGVLGLAPGASSFEIERTARQLQAKEFVRIAELVASKVKAYFAAPAESAPAVPTVYKLSPREQAYLEQGEAVAEFFVQVSNLASKLVSWLVEPVKAFAHRSSMRNELTSLDDRTLADIGLTRGDIERVASGLWVPENRTAQISPAALRPAVANHDKPQIAA